MPHDVALGAYPFRTGAGDIHHAAQERPSRRHGEMSCDIPVIPVQRQGFVMSLAVGMQGQKAYGLGKTPPLCAVLVVQFFP